MPRKKRSDNLKYLVGAVVLIIGTWFAADYYYNNLRSPKIETKVVGVEKENSPKQPDSKIENNAAAESPAVLDGTALVLQSYTDPGKLFELRYPVASAQGKACPILEKEENGFSAGLFSFMSSELGAKSLNDYINDQLYGMTVDGRSEISINGIPAVKIDYQTAGMGFNGSTTFIEHNGKVYEFGFLANEPLAKCGGTDSYEDKVYQSVISTLKFTN